MKTKLLMIASAVIVALASCTETTDEMGTSITPAADALKITTDTFNVTSQSILADSVLALGSCGYLGKVLDPETGTYVTANYMAQFSQFDSNPFKYDTMSISIEDGKYVADSCELYLIINTNLYGDTTNLMRVRAYELAKPMEETETYYTDFDIKTSGLIREDGIQKDITWTPSNRSLIDKVGYIRAIRIPLNEKYTDKEGNTYKNYGTYIMQKWYDKPEAFSTLYKFNHQVCPGFYFENVAGLGTMAEITATMLRVYYKLQVTTTTTTDSTTEVSIDTVCTETTFASTEEVMQTTNIINDTKRISELAQDKSCTYLKTPAGLFTELTIPVDEILANHENDTINSAKITLQRINNESGSDYTFDVPGTLLMLPKDSLYTYFENKEVPDSKSSFISTLNSGNSSSSSKPYNCYVFNNFGGLVTKMINDRANGLKTDSDWEAKHPDWNKVVLVPIQTTYVTIRSSSTLTKVYNDLTLSSTRLVGGDTPIKMSVVYSKFTGE